MSGAWFGSSTSEARRLRRGALRPRQSFLARQHHDRGQRSQYLRHDRQARERTPTLRRLASRRYDDRGTGARRRVVQEDPEQASTALDLPVRLDHVRAARPRAFRGPASGSDVMPQPPTWRMRKRRRRIHCTSYLYRLQQFRHMDGIPLQQQEVI